jgi:hypothetical protein
MPMLRSRTVREPLASRLLFPLVEGAFTYRRYDEWLDTIASVNVVPLRELAGATTPVVGLRHDVDERLDGALELARLEHRRGLRSTYFVLHTAPYYADRGRLVPALRRLQDDYGHEIGWHNDLATLSLVQGVDPGPYLERELAALRGAGIDIVGSAAHGSPHAHHLGYHNNYVFAGWDDPQPGFPRVDVGAKLDPSQFGLEYEAYHLPYDVYVSDSRFDGGRRMHPSRLGTVMPDQRAVVLVHPCHWDRSRLAKAGRLGRKVARRLVNRRSPQ